MLFIQKKKKDSTLNENRKLIQEKTQKVIDIWRKKKNLTATISESHHGSWSESEKKSATDPKNFPIFASINLVVPSTLFLRKIENAACALHKRQASRTKVKVVRSLNHNAAFSTIYF